MLTAYLQRKRRVGWDEDGLNSRCFAVRFGSERVRQDPHSRTTFLSRKVATASPLMISVSSNLLALARLLGLVRDSC
jgi:hypothetical protein